MKAYSGRTERVKSRNKCRGFSFWIMRGRFRGGGSVSSPLYPVPAWRVWFMKEDTIQLTLIPHEQEVLSWAVESVISDLGTEIGHTDNWAMRQDLQERKGVLLAILERLRATD